MSTSKFLSRIGTIAIAILLILGNVQPALAQTPSNDYFSSATAISNLPFTTTVDLNSATMEFNEPYPDCSYGVNSVWFSYTPLTNVTLTARSNNYNSVLAIYTGSTIDNLARVSCGFSNPQLTFQAQKNVTYYFQLSTSYPGCWWCSSYPFSLEVTPPPNVSIYFDPWDPSIFDNVWFNSYIWDPAGIYGDTYAWTLGDGTISNQSSFQHRFAADGDYPVSLTYTTFDGRSNTANTTLQVRTRDVAITKFTVPQTAKVNTTKEITVEVANRRYSDNVQVQLFKGLPGGGEQLIGTLTIYVPSRANRATLFKFSYTFTGCDAAIGKVTFRTVATLMSGRDALPADNTAIRTTLVTGSGSCSPTSYP